MIPRAKQLMRILGQDLDKDKILTIREVKIPNFYLMTPFQWEFCHQLVELYEEYIFGNDFMYEHNQVKITSSDIVFDCGANMGLFAAYAASKGAKVYAFEPNEKILACLKAVQICYPNITIIPLGCYSLDGVISYDECDNIGANHLSKYPHPNKTLSQKIIKVTSLDCYANENNVFPTFIKMDVEGAEQDILIGSNQILFNQPKMAISCYHQTNDSAGIVNQILQFNSHYNFIPFKQKLIFAY